MLISIIAPCYNEEEVIRETHARLSSELVTFEGDLEMLYINDGSRDATLETLIALREQDPRIRIVSFARNFGHQTAVSAGLDYAKGDAVVVIDADLQDPPAVILGMIAKWQDGFDVVYGVRRTRDGEPAWRLAAIRFFYRFLQRISEIPIPLDSGDFRLMDRRVVDILKSMPERDRYIRGLAAWVGFRQSPIAYDRLPRFAGESKYPLGKLIGLALDGILSFSMAPLRLANRLGFACAGIALVGILYTLAIRLFTSSWPSGWATLMLGVLFMGGVQLLCLGILGEYVGRIYRQSKNRPLYVVGYDSEDDRSRILKCSSE